MSSSRNSTSLAPINNDEKVVMILCGCTSGLGLVALAATVLYFVRTIQNKKDVVKRQWETKFQPNLKEPAITFVKTIISFILILFELFFTSLSFFSGLQSYDALLSLTKESSTGVPGVNSWLQNGTARGYPTVTSLGGRLAIYLAIASAVLFAFAMLAPYFLTYAFVLKDGSEPPLVENKVLTTIWSLIKKAVGWVIVRVLVFALNYNAKYLLVIFIIIPWGYATKSGLNVFLNILYIIWALILSIMLVSAFTVQGFWASVVRATIISDKATTNITNSFNQLWRTKTISSLLNFALAAVLSIAYILVISALMLVVLVLKVLLAFPEPIGIRMVPPCYFCRQHKAKRSLNPKEMTMLLLFPQFVVNDRVAEEFHDEKHPPPTMIEWTRFTTAYTLSFIMTIPWAGPYLFLLGNMLSRSGFWFAPFFLFIEREVTEDKRVKYVNRITENFGKHFTPGKEDYFLQIFHKWYWMLRESDYKRMVNYEGDNGKFLRCMLMVIIPMIAIIPILVPDTRSGFSTTELLQFIFYGKRWT